MKFFKRAWPWLAAVLSGVLLVLSFPPADVGGLAFVALIPLLMAVWIPQREKRRGRRHFALGYLACLVFVTLTFSWFSELAPLFRSRALIGLPLYKLSFGDMNQHYHEYTETKRTLDNALVDGLAPHHANIHQSMISSPSTGRIVPEKE